MPFKLLYALLLMGGGEGLPWKKNNGLFPVRSGSDRKAYSNL